METNIKTIRNVLLFFAIIFSFYLMKMLSGLFIPLVLALFIAFLFYPFIKWLVNKKIPYFVSVIFIVGLLAFILYIIGERFADAIAEFYIDRELLIAGFKQRITPIMEFSSKYLGVETVNYMVLAEDFLRETFTAGMIFDFSGTILMTLIYLAFILAGNVLKYDEYIDYLEDDKARSRPELNDALHKVRVSVTRYMGIKTALSIITGFLYWVICLIFNVEYAFLWGILAFLLNFIPYFGSIIAAFFPFIIGFITIDSLTAIIIFGLLLIMVQQILGNFVEPVWMGKQFSINTIVILFGLVLFTYIWGSVGAILSVPLLVFGKIILQQIPEAGFWVRLIGKNNP